MKHKEAPAENEREGGRRDDEEIKVSQKMNSFQNYVPPKPTCDTILCDSIIIKTIEKATRRFASVQEFREKLNKIDSEIWPLENEAFPILENKETEEYEVSVPSVQAQAVYNTIQRLRISCDVIQYARLTMDLIVPPGTQRICLRVARFGEVFKRYDAKLGKLVDKGGKPIKVKAGAETEHVELEVNCSTRYAIKYCITNGEKHKKDVVSEEGVVLHKQGDIIWSEYSKKVQVRTPSEDQPPPPALQSKPGGKLGIHLPKLPPNAQHLTLWLKRGQGEFKVFDYLTKKVVENEGRAIPIWDFGRYVELKLEPDVEYTVKYSLMQNDTWRKIQSFQSTATTGPSLAYFANVQPCYKK